MSDSQQTDPAPRWWSRPEGLADVRREGVPAPRPETGAAPAEVAAEVAAAPEAPAGAAEGDTAGEAEQPHAGPHADPEPRYDPWGVAPLQAVDTGKPGRGIRMRHVVAISVGSAVLAGGIGGYVGVLAERQSSTRLELPQAGVESKGRAPESVAGIAATALPGVVTLHVSGGGSSATGTGFVLDPQGHILTNNHVVAGAKKITVTFSTGESVTAELVGRDSGYDLAVVKVTGVRGLQPLTLGNSENVKVGDPVVAIGAPFDLSNTVTAGIISATGRPITAGGDKGDGSDISYVDALQTDAPINPGNSGGPLLDAKARVIGINSAIRGADKQEDSDRQGGSIGLGFAIPINQGKRVAEELIRTGRATHPVIGVTLDMQYTGDGARVAAKGEDGRSSVVAGGPGASAGIKPGDVITKVDGARVHGGDELIIKIRAHRPGDRLSLTVLREGRERTLEMVLGSANGS
ncbi:MULTISPECIES: S1C family serine protease [unclassified Streptomyces]|uniref:S1C family serine protease n=1 Tax=unclassified Streptomyces TaxID=2593676 RepID=UPI001BE7013B|nr:MULTISPECIES: trypsin-like peptidase domain-containing protein [unclassified Streptomyces]MBT2402995.1 trypsin-like peptidase domain-containing protein [Streptomyces sp. ISL-21]MBT2455355.1 trypsin-like peptidase domain-containing protein [Streptomyces sp. ISL-86]MBT2609648.1 trypsin-like peptidase domain-containing protein [Streptomyces sp. ISL-87]